MTSWPREPIDRLAVASSAIEQLEAALAGAVAQARRDGASWHEIARRLGVAKQSAWRRFKEDRRMKRTSKRCSFCGDGQKQVRHLVVAPSGACICDECLALAQQMVDDATS